MSEESKQKAIILLIQGGAGDVLAATPMIRSFRKEYPDDEIAVLATHAYILENNPSIDNLMSFNLDRELRSLYNKYMAGDKEVRFFKHFFPYDAFDDTPRYESKNLPEFLCNLYGVPYDGKPLDYVITSYEREAATAFMQQFQKPAIMLHLTGVLPMKSVKLDLFQPIVAAMSDKYDFIQVGATNEPVLEGVHNALGMPIRDTVSIMPHMKICVLIESLFAHCSNALQLPSLVIFQSTSPEFFGYANHTQIWDAHDCKEWPCNRPIGALNKFLPAYKNLQTGEPLPWMCPKPVCANLEPRLIQESIINAIKVIDDTTPAATLAEARNK